MDVDIRYSTKSITEIILQVALLPLGSPFFIRGMLVNRFDKLERNEYVAILRGQKWCTHMLIHVP